MQRLSREIYDLRRNPLLEDGELSNDAFNLTMLEIVCISEFGPSHKQEG